MKEPRFKNGIEVLDKSIRDVPIGLWMWFAGYCHGSGKTITQVITEVLTSLREATNDQEKKGS